MNDAIKDKELIIKKFSFPEMKKLRKNSSYRTKSDNAENYANWTISVLKEEAGKELSSNEQFNACSIYMNKKNIELLHDYLEPMTWLNYSPAECNELKDDELGIDLSSIIKERI